MFRRAAECSCLVEGMAPAGRKSVWQEGACEHRGGKADDAEECDQRAESHRGRVCAMDRDPDGFLPAAGALQREVPVGCAPHGPYAVDGDDVCRRGYV